MSTLQTVLAVLGGLVAIASVAGGIWAVFRTSARDAETNRLRAWNGDLIQRLDWIEPRFKTVTQQNELLMQLHNPTSQLEAMGTKAQANHDQIVEVLREQSALLEQIDEKLPHSVENRGGS